MALPTKALQSFTIFEKLPLELRIKIWKFTLPGPRVVSLRFNRGAKQYTSSTTPPILLRTCPESRAVALETYTILILAPKYPSSVFVDFALDTVFFDSLECSPRGRSVLRSRDKPAQRAHLELRHRRPALGGAARLSIRESERTAVDAQPEDRCAHHAEGYGYEPAAGGGRRGRQVGGGC